MIAYAGNTNSMLLNPLREDVPGLTAVRTQLDLITSQHNNYELMTELEPQLCHVGDPRPSKEQETCAEYSHHSWAIHECI